MKFREMTYDDWKSFVNQFEIEEGYEYPSWFIEEDDLCITASILDGNSLSKIFKNRYVTNNEDKFIFWHEAISKSNMISEISDYDSEDFDQIYNDLTSDVLNLMRIVR